MIVAPDVQRMTTPTNGFGSTADTRGKNVIYGGGGTFPPEGVALVRHQLYVDGSKCMYPCFVLIPVIRFGRVQIEVASALRDHPSPLFSTKASMA